jgi:hypothetical protein
MSLSQNYNQLSVTGNSNYLGDAINSQNQNLSYNISLGKNNIGTQTPSTNYLSFTTNNDGSVSYSDQGLQINVSCSETLTDLSSIIQPYVYTNNINNGFNLPTATDAQHLTYDGFTSYYGIWFQYDLSAFNSSFYYNTLTINVPGTQNVQVAVFGNDNPNGTPNWNWLTNGQYTITQTKTIDLNKSVNWPYLRVVFYGLVSFSLSSLQINNDYTRFQRNIATYAISNVNIGNTGVPLALNCNGQFTLNGNSFLDDTYPPVSTSTISTSTSNALTSVYNFANTMLSNNTVNILTNPTGASNIFLGNVTTGTTTIYGTSVLSAFGGKSASINGSTVNVGLLGSSLVNVLTNLGTGFNGICNIGTGAIGSSNVNIGTTANSSVTINTQKLTVGGNGTQTISISGAPTSGTLNIHTASTGASNVNIGTASFGRVNLFGNCFVNNVPIQPTTFFLRYGITSAFTTVATTQYKFFDTSIGAVQQNGLLGGLTLASVLNTGTITIPYVGMYGVNMLINFTATSTSTVQLFSVSGTYGTNVVISLTNNNGASTWNSSNNFIGYFAAGDVIVASFNTGSAVLLNTNPGYVVASIALLQRLV